MCSKWRCYKVRLGAAVETAADMSVRKPQGGPVAQETDAADGRGWARRNQAVRWE